MMPPCSFRLGFSWLAAVVIVSAQDQEFESPGPVPTAELLPAAMISGPGYAVEPLAYADGLYLAWRLETPESMEAVVGIPTLALRLREIEAIAKLREMNKSEEFAKALVQAGKDKVRSVTNLIKDPIGSVKRLPQGASRFFGRISDSIHQVDEGGTDGRQIAESALGVSRKKAELALRLGVSIYSHDPVLQDELDRAARAMAGGALLVNVAGMALDGGAATAMTVLGVNETLQRALIESTPEELRENNRQQLLRLHASPDYVSRFQLNAAISPWQESTIVSALSSLRTSPDAFLVQAADAVTAQDAIYFEQLARLLQKLHSEGPPLVQLRLEHQILCALSKDGTLTVPVAADYILWTPMLDQRAREFLELASPESAVKRIRVVTDGRFSPRAEQELSRLGVSIAGEFLGSLR